LHQRDLDSLYRRLPGWTPHVELVPGAPERCLLVVDPTADAGPVYRSKSMSTSLRWLGLDVRELVATLERELELPTPPLERTLLLHLSETWGQAQSRGFMRIDSRETLLISIGLDATHRHVAGNEDFDALTSRGDVESLVQEAGNPFTERRVERQTRSKDIWDSVYEHGAAQAAELEQMELRISEHRRRQADTQPLPPLYRVETVNTSPRGYCVQWLKDADAPLQSGEIMGVRRERGGGGWMVGVVRWVRMADSAPEVGIELLSAGAVPYVVRNRGQGAPQRVMMLPAMKAIGQPATLLTPRLPFSEQQKLILLREGEEIRLVLTKQVAGTNGFNQFEFREIEQDRQVPLMPPVEEHGFDGLWERL
jgi:hypothetical protein